MPRRFCCLIPCLSVALLASALAGETAVEQPTETIKVDGIDGELPLLRHITFEEENVTDLFEPTDPKAWEITKGNGGSVYHLKVKKSKYTPPVRSPYNRSLLKGTSVTDFVLDVKFKSTSPDYNHRSLCLFFGFQDPRHFHYVHFGKKADPHANQIFIVNDAPRTKISLTTTDGTPWDDKWHHARIVRNPTSGTIAVYFDDMVKPAMTAKDTTFTSGLVGVGSFDDPGQFDDLKVYGRPAKDADEGPTESE